jgi:soluble cytochrome b562
MSNFEYVYLTPAEITNSVDYLNRSFARTRKEYIDKTAEKPERNFNGKSSSIKEYEEDFCYIINEVTRGPVYLAEKNISDAKELIRQMYNIINEY